MALLLHIWAGIFQEVINILSIKNIEMEMVAP